MVLAGIWMVGAVAAVSFDFFCLSYDVRKAETVQAAGNSAAAEESTGTEDDLQSQLEQAEKKRNELEKKKAETQKDLEAIRSARDDMEKYIKKLDNKLNELTVSIEENQKEIDTIQTRMEELEDELANVQEHQREQYESTKSRIKYIYENSSESYLQILLEAKSLADLCSRMEYIEKITAYDRNLLLSYHSVEEEVLAAKDSVAAQLEDLNATKDTLQYEKKVAKKLIRQKNEQMKIFAGNADAAQADVESYAEQIMGQEDAIEELLEKQRQQIAEQEAQQGDTAGKTVVPVSGEYAWPLVSAGRISSYFGYRNAPTAGASSYHKGIDIAAPLGTSILASKAGTVVTSTYSTSAGNYIAIYHGNGVYTYYMHCSRLLVSAGDKVKKGQVIGQVGSTGVSTGAHLHFGINVNNTYVNPLKYVKQP